MIRAPYPEELLMPREPVRRGWRERIERGIYRGHRAACPSSVDRRPGRRCACPLQVVLVADAGTRWVTLEGAGVPDARRARARAAADAGTVRATPSVNDETLHTFAVSWFRARAVTLRPATLEIHQRCYTKRIAPTLGGFRLEELTRERLEAWLGELVRHDSALRAIEQSIATLRAMLSTAVEWDRLAVNPALRLRMPKSADTDAAAVERVLSPTQVERMLAHVGVSKGKPAPNLRGETLLRCAVEAGLRRGEIIGLRWGDVDFESRRLILRQSVWQGRAGERVEQTPKSGQARRVAISADLAARLEAYFREQVLERGAPAGGFVWPGRSGRALGRDSPGQYLARVLIRAGLATPAATPDDDPVPFVSFHGLRHTAAAIAFSKDVPLLTISRQLGHASPAITARVYAHLQDSQLDEFADAMGGSNLRADLRAAPAAGDSA